MTTYDKMRLTIDLTESVRQWLNDNGYEMDGTKFIDLGRTIKETIERYQDEQR